MQYKTEGIVIRCIDYGEGNKIITLFTKEQGKVSVIARGAKKLKSRFSAVSQLFTYGQFFYFQNGQMGNLQHAEILKSNHRLREDLSFAAYTSYLMEIVDRMTDEHYISPTLFEQILAAVEAIQDGKDAEVVLHIFELKMLITIGYAPRLEHCANCTEHSLHAFSVVSGGMICKACSVKEPKAMVIQNRTLKILQLFSSFDLKRLGKIELKLETKQELKKVIRSFIDYHMGVQWKARKFIEQMEKYSF